MSDTLEEKLQDMEVDIPVDDEEIDDAEAIDAIGPLGGNVSFYSFSV